MTWNVYVRITIWRLDEIAPWLGLSKVLEIPTQKKRFFKSEKLFINLNAEKRSLILISLTTSTKFNWAQNSFEFSQHERAEKPGLSRALIFLNKFEKVRNKFFGEI